MVTVNTKYGILAGQQQDGYVSFLGVPYAKPPVGELRWREPQEPDSWDGIREAFAFGNPACQAPSQVIPGGDPADKGVIGNGSEDCLYLNVWSPDLKPEKPMPVFVWIHGGAFCCGSGAGKSASPEPFCSRGIVYVSINYRLGLMGYFAHPELSKESPHHVSGNYAHFDQVAALKWVHENIAAFGGDPSNVTIGGCSAGAGSTQVMCNTPLTEGLFQRAIIESSVGLACALYPEKDKLSRMDEMEARGVEFMELVGCKSVEEMRAMSYEELVAHPDAAFRRKYHYGTSIGLNEDGYLLPKHYNDTMEVMENRNIPYLVGNTQDEGVGFFFKMNMEIMENMNRVVFEDEIGDFMKLAREVVGEDPVQILHDTHLRYAGAKAFAALNNEAGREPVYVFSFARKDPAQNKAYHGLETRYLLGTYKKMEGMNEEDDQVAHDMQEYWCNFIKTGNPNGGELPMWEPYTEANPKALVLDAPTVIRHDKDTSPLEQMTVKVILKKLREKNK